MPLNPLKPFTFPVIRSVAPPLLVLLAVFSCWSPLAHAKASSALSGYEGSDLAFRLAVTPVGIRIDAPTPLSGNNLELLLLL